MKNDLTILYLEDDPEIAENMSFLLGRYAKEVYLAMDGEKAIELFLQKNPQIAVLDIMVPKMNGLDVAKKIREKNKKIPIIFMTAFNEDEQLKVASEIPSSSYIVKPFNLETLNKAISKAIEEK